MYTRKQRWTLDRTLKGRQDGDIHALPHGNVILLLSATRYAGTFALK